MCSSLGLRWRETCRSVPASQKHHPQIFFFFNLTNVTNGRHQLSGIRCKTGGLSAPKTRDTCTSALSLSPHMLQLTVCVCVSLWRQSRQLLPLPWQRRIITRPVRTTLLLLLLQGDIWPLDYKSDQLVISFIFIPINGWNLVGYVWLVTWASIYWSQIVPGCIWV